MSRITERSTLAGVGALLLSGCVIGYDPIGGDGDDEADALGEEDGDTHTTNADTHSNADADTDAGTDDETGVDSGSGDESDTGEECTTPGDPAQLYAMFWLDVALVGEFEDGDVDLECTVSDLHPYGEFPTLDCSGAFMGMAFEAEPALDLPFETGATVHLRLVKTQEPIGFWMRLDFEGHDTLLTVISAPELEPPAPVFLPVPWSLERTALCGPQDRGCALQFHAIEATRGGETIRAGTLETFPDIDMSLPSAYASTAAQDVEMWVTASWEYVDEDQICAVQPSYSRLVLVSRGHLVEGDACQGEVTNCAPWLACCGGECTPVDEQTLGCPDSP